MDFSAFNKDLLDIGLALAKVGGGAATLCVVGLAFINMYGIFNPRAGAMVKSGLIVVILSGVLLGGAGAIAAIFGSL